MCKKTEEFLMDIRNEEFKILEDITLVQICLFYKPCVILTTNIIFLLPVGLNWFHLKKRELHIYPLKLKNLHISSEYKFSMHDVQCKLSMF